MPYEVEFTVRITVNDESEAIRLQDAVYSGYAAEIMRIGVLFGQIPVGGVVPGGATPQITREQQEARQRAASMEVQRVENRTGSVTVPKEEPRPVRPKGLAGRQRLGRT